MIAVALLLSLLTVSPDPYQQALLPTPARADIDRLLALGVEVKPTDSPAYLRIIGRASELVEAEDMGFPMEIEIVDLEAWASSQMSGRGDFGAYYTYAEAVTRMNELNALYPSLVTAPQSLGLSGQGNAIWAMKVSDNPAVDEDEPAILFTGVHHAREPIGCTLCLDFIEYLASGYGTDPLCTFLVNQREFWFVPVVNPDGYLYNESTNPNGGGMWRKNRRTNGDGSYGVDLNRNYPYQWGYDNSGSSPTPSSDTYRGPSAGSEPEVQVMMAFCQAQGFTAAQNWHSYSNLLLYSWGYDDFLTPDDDAFDTQAADATMGIGYSTGTAWELLYNTNGDANDWMYGDPAKPKVFACTGEVGEDFWQESQIPVHIAEGRQISTVQSLYAGPLPESGGITVDDAAANNNTRLDPGETASLLVSLYNKGFHGSPAVTATVACDDPYLQISPAQITFTPFPALTLVQGSPGVEVTVDPACPMGWAGSCHLIVEGQWVRPDTIAVPLTVGRPTILVVDADNEPTETRLIDALGRAPIAFDTWYEPGNPVTLDLLRLYRAVIWTAGDQNVSSIPTADRQALSAYLDLGGALLLSAENYLSAYGSDPFTSQYLHVSSYTTSISVSSVQGMATDPVTDGIAMNVSFPGGLSNAPDAVVPDAQATGILRYNNGSAYTAIRYPATGSSTFRVIFTATPLEAMLPPTTALEETLESMVSWLLLSSDTSPPSAPISLTAQAGPGPGQATLTWTPSSDNVGVAHYRIYESAQSVPAPVGALLLDVAAASPFVRTIPAPEPGRAFWAVSAVDAGGNESGPSPASGSMVFTLGAP
ncbi:zinc carboxypeptidase [Candidatus Fermentibacteria bacterium]|nr:zinc carboxypeptidase [Candidatus Fermentibacteria bacterium]